MPCANSCRLWLTVPLGRFRYRLQGESQISPITAFSSTAGQAGCTNSRKKQQPVSRFESADCADFLTHCISVIGKICANVWIMRQAATVLAVPLRFADRIFAFNASISRSRGGAFVTSD